MINLRKKSHHARDQLQRKDDNQTSQSKIVPVTGEEYMQKKTKTDRRWWKTNRNVPSNQCIWCL